jgi:antagonist of KipI
LGLLVVKPGLFGTIQGLGRDGYRSRGVPVGGAFDVRSHELACALVGDPPQCATLELTLRGGTFEATCDLALALAGATMDATIEGRDGSGRPLGLPRSFTLRGGERLVLGGARDGARTYLAVAGGWRTRVILGSRSSEVPIRAGDRLPAAAPSRIAMRHPADRPRNLGHGGEIRVVAGPDAAWLAGEWPEGPYRVSPRSDRMGLRLEGAELPVRSPADRVSVPVLPGAVQVAGGRLLVLGVACGTMGGYPHVAQVVSADLAPLGQLRPGDAVRFRPVSLAEARALDDDDRRCRAELRTRIAAAALDPWFPGAPDPRKT